MGQEEACKKVNATAEDSGWLLSACEELTALQAARYDSR